MWYAAGVCQCLSKITLPDKSERDCVLRKPPKIWPLLFNISVMAEASDFKFGTELGFAKLNYKITPKDKSGPGPWVGDSQKFGVSFNIFAMAEVAIAVPNKRY